MAGFCSPYRYRTRTDRMCHCCKERIPKGVFYCRYDYAGRQHKTINTCDWCQVYISSEYRKVIYRKARNDFVERLERGEIKGSTIKGTRVKAFNGESVIVGEVVRIYYDNNELTAQVKIDSDNDYRVNIKVFDSEMKVLL